jgi:hypothetical protein
MQITINSEVVPVAEITPERGSKKTATSRSRSLPLAGEFGFVNPLLIDKDKKSSQVAAGYWRRIVKA